MSDHYLEEEPKSWVECTHDFFCKHVFLTFLFGFLLGQLLQPYVYIFLMLVRIK